MDNALVIGASGGIGAALADRLDAKHFVTRLSRRDDGLDVTDPVSVVRVMNRIEGPVHLAFIATGILARTAMRRKRRLTRSTPTPWPGPSP